RYRRFADLGVAAYLFGDVERLLEQLVEHQPERPSRLRAAHRLLHLTQDLRLTQDHGIEPARYAESMLDRTLPGQRLEGGFEQILLELVIPREPLHGRVRLRGVAIELGAVAGRDDGRLTHRLVVYQIAQGMRQPLAIERDPFTHGERCRLMIQAKRKELHDAINRKNA